MRTNWVAIFPDAAQREAAKRVAVVAASVERQSKLWCPVDSGLLRNSISTSGPDAEGTRGVRASVGTGVFYAPFVEYGTRNMTARPFLGKALSWAAGVFKGVQTR